MQGCWSWFIYYGTGSNIFAQSESGSGYKLKQCMLRLFLSQIFLHFKFESNQFVQFFAYLLVAFLFNITEKCIFQWNSLIYLLLDPDPGSGFPICIRIQIHKVAESGSNPDPQPCFQGQLRTQTLLLLRSSTTQVNRQFTTSPFQTLSCDQALRPQTNARVTIRFYSISNRHSLYADADPNQVFESNRDFLKFHWFWDFNLAAYPTHLIII
jgi:hypothetical protein